MSDESEVGTPSLELQMLASLEKVSPETAVPESKGDASSGAITHETDAPDGDVDDQPADADDESGASDESETADIEDADSPVLDEESAEFVDAMKKRGITTDLSDVPKELRSVLIDKVKAMDAGYTKVRQEAAAFRSEKAAFEVQQSYIEKNTEQHIADLITKNPDLVELVNAEVERRKDPTYSAALAKQREVDQRDAALKVKEDDQAEQRLVTRRIDAEALDTHVEHSAEKAGVPIELVGKAITLLTEQLRDKEDRLPTKAELDALIQEHATVYKKHVGVEKATNSRKKTREYLDAKRQDKADASNAGKPSGAVTTTDGLPAKKPASLEEAFNAALDRMGAAA